MGLTSAKGVALTASLFWSPRVSAQRHRRKQKGLCCLSVILYESCMLIHYCASSMVCEFLLLLEALIQYVMCRELRIRVSVILHSKELGQGSKQSCWFLEAGSSKMVHHGMRHELMHWHMRTVEDMVSFLAQ
uniref:Uncharacterized protein n=1 Tax=Triticum urartu TaxID=4572 RepID=A0A8R7JX76_TRIUA